MKCPEVYVIHIIICHNVKTKLGDFIINFVTFLENKVSILYHHIFGKSEKKILTKLGNTYIQIYLNAFMSIWPSSNLNLGQKLDI